MQINQMNKEVFGSDERTVVLNGLESPDKIAARLHKVIQDFLKRTAPRLPVAIEGPIGGGKSTLLKVMESKYGYRIIPEPTKTYWREPLKRFYEDPRGRNIWFQKIVSEWYSRVANCLNGAMHWEDIEKELQLKDKRD